jgi:riboflavin transporter FmnP
MSTEPVKPPRNERFVLDLVSEILFPLSREYVQYVRLNGEGRLTGLEMALFVVADFGLNAFKAAATIDDPVKGAIFALAITSVVELGGMYFERRRSL